MEKFIMGRSGDQGRRAGFSLIEVTLVVAIAMVVTATAIPSITTVVANAKMRASMTSLSGLLQNCRMAAVQQNKTMTTKFVAQTTGLVGYVKDATDSSALARKDYQVEMQAPINKLTTPSGGGAPAAISTLGFTPQTGNPSFNTRGLPCLYSAGACTNYGFISYYKDTRIAGSGGWAAISISPAGRIKRWFWNGSDWTD